MEFRLASSTGSNLESYHVIVNGVPVKGESGKKIEEKTTTFSSEVNIKLSKGANTIQCYGIDEKGFISNKEVVTIFADYDEITRTHLILISADTYRNSDYNLKYPVKDARDLASNLQKRYGRNLIVDSLFNEEITLDNLNKVRERISKVSVNDRIILFISGHGVLDSNLEFRFATPDMDFDQVDSYGITNSQIEDLLVYSPAREKLLLIDACHSGEFDREHYEKAMASSVNQEVKIYEGRKGAIASDVKPSDSTFELMNQLFTNVSESTGIKVISAAAGNSFALESDKWNNGVFTFSLLSTLEEHQSISTSELKKKAFGKVVSLTDGYQRPTSRGETIEFDFSLIGLRNSTQVLLMSFLAIKRGSFQRI